MQLNPRDGLRAVGIESDIPSLTTVTTPRGGPSVQGGAALRARLGALAQPKYRRYWLGSLASVGAVQLVMLAQGWLIVGRLGGSALDLGYLGAATALPTIAVNLAGGVLADRFERRRLLMGTSLVAAVLLALLATLDATGAVQIWHIIAVAAAMGLVYGVDWPVRNALFPALIERDQMASAVALNAILWQSTRIVAPAVGGVAIAYFGTPVLFYAAAAGFVAMVLVLLSLQVRSEAPAGPRRVMQELRQGVHFVATTRIFAALILLTYANMFFGLEYLQLMPLMAVAFATGAQGLGLLFTTVGLGAVGGTLVMLWVRPGRHLGRLLLAGSGASSLLVVGFAAAPSYPVALVLVFLAALSNALFLIGSMTVLQLRVPDALRGRVMGIHAITFSLIPLGGLLGGVVAAATDVRIAIATGALVLTAIVAFVASTQREVRELDGRRMSH